MNFRWELPSRRRMSVWIWVHIHLFISNLCNLLWAQFTQSLCFFLSANSSKCHVDLKSCFKNKSNFKDISSVSTEKAMAPHSSTLAWKIPWMEEPGGLQSVGSRRVGHDWVTSFPLFTFMHWRRKWWPTPMFLPGESQGWGNLAGCHLWGRTESDTTEET